MAIPRATPVAITGNSHIALLDRAVETIIRDTNSEHALVKDQAHARRAGLAVREGILT